MQPTVSTQTAERHPHPRLPGRKSAEKCTLSRPEVKAKRRLEESTMKDRLPGGGRAARMLCGGGGGFRYKNMSKFMKTVTLIKIKTKENNKAAEKSVAKKSLAALLCAQGGEMNKPSTT